MTVPTERSYAIHNTHQFLFDLLDKKKTPRVAKEIRERARRLLRHYPDTYYINSCAKNCPDTFGPIEAELDHMKELFPKIVIEREIK